MEGNQVTDSRNSHVKMANPKSFGFSDFLLRMLATATTLAAALVMGLAKETQTVPFVLVPGTAPLLVQVPAKMRYSSAFVQAAACCIISVVGTSVLISTSTYLLIYFVVANAIASGYAVLSLLVTIGARTGPKGLALGITILDVIMVALLFSGNGAAMTMGLLGYKGNSHVGWNEVCNTFEKFCHNVMVAILLSMIGSVLFVLLAARSIFNLHRRSP